MKCGTGQSRRAQALLEYGINGVADNRHYETFAPEGIEALDPLIRRARFPMKAKRH
jgi:hypothetical protein